ncbi:MAG: hypothetical protein ABJF01_13720 [bacterium]
MQRMHQEHELTDVRHPSDFDLSRAKHQVEFVVGVANRVIGLVLTIGGLALAANWRIRYGGFGALRAFYLYVAWAFGSLELLASVGMLRRWPVRWVLQMLPLVVPVIAYQYFILRFIFRRI